MGTRGGRDRLMLPALLAAGALAVAGCGGDDGATGGASETAGNGTDRAFVAAMIPHHESAVEMAKVAQERGESDFVKQLAEDIEKSQSEEISTMRDEDAELADAGVEIGSLGVPEHLMGMHEDAEQLRAVEPFDEAFIEMMVPHHRGAIEMARVQLEEGSDPELKALAEDIIDAQEREISDMEKHLGGGATEDGGHGGHSG